PPASVRRAKLPDSRPVYGQGQLSFGGGKGNCRAQAAGIFQGRQIRPNIQRFSILRSASSRSRGPCHAVELCCETGDELVEISRLPSEPACAAPLGVECLLGLRLTLLPLLDQQR